ncbi:MAG: tetratricopeptide repeat protein [Chloroflexota bacterium]|nr:tetratricopeptide repeat protein [Chloroflexota bacterium]
MHHDLLLKYIPRDRCQSLVDHSELAVQCEGTVLFVDISGFTSLAESLARLYGARRGAEELTRQLNRVYDVVCEEIDRYHGSILGFSGDAVTCWFNNESRPDEGAWLAVTCAFALQTAIQALPPVLLADDEQVEFYLKTTIASGPAYRFVVGDPEIQKIDVLVGDTLDRMAEGESWTKRGEVIADSTTVDLLCANRETLEIAEWRVDPDSGNRFALLARLLNPHPPYPWLPLQPEMLTPEQVRSWLMKAIYERDDEMLTELRQAAALFVTFEGIDYEHDPLSYDKLNRLVSWVQSILIRYGGTLIQLTTGEKGGFLYFAFGAPVAYDNNAELAAQAALDLLALPPDLDFVSAPRIGLTQGFMRTGAYGGKTRRVYGVLSDETNLAARLMQSAASGEILISQRFAKAVAGKFVLLPLEPLKLKGKRDPVPVLRLLGKAEASRTRAGKGRKLVGRSEELALLIHHFETVRQQTQGSAVYVSGEPGIGKSHLISAAAERAGVPERITWYTCSSEQIVRHSLHVFLPFLTTVLQPEGGETEHQKKMQFEMVIEGLIEKLLLRETEQALDIALALDEARWFLGSLLGLRWNGSLYENLEPKLRFERALHAVATFVRAASFVHPLVLHIQDAQWLDEDSVDLLRILIHGSANSPYVVLMDSRISFDAFREQLGLTTNVPLHVLDLNRLSEASVRELAEDVLRVTITDSMCQFLIQRASGNPFFTEQLALDLSERAMLIRLDNGSWDLSSSLPDELPMTIDAILVARLDRLINEVRNIVQVASVLGQQFVVPVLARMVRQETQLLDYVHEAESEAIWTKQDDEEVTYLFRHVLLRDAAYRMQLQERLRELHLLAGQAIEQIYEGDLSSFYPELAFHFEHAGQHDRAVTYLILAAKAMMDVYANREAMDYFQRATKIAQEIQTAPLEMPVIHEGLGDLYEMRGEYEQAITNYNEAQRWLPEGQPSIRSRLLRKGGEVLLKWGSYADASARYEEALRELQADFRADEASRIYAGLSMILYRQNQIDDAIELAQLALVMAQEGKPNQAQALQNLGMLYWKRLERDVALQYNLQSLALWQELNNLNGSAAVHNNLGLLYQHQGDFETAITHYKLSLAQCEQVGNRHGLARVYDNLGQAYMELNNQAAAIQCLESAVAILATIGLTDSEVFSGMWLSGMW